MPEGPDPDPAIPTAAACVHSLLIVRTAWHASGYSAPLHGHIKAIKVQTLVLTNRHLIRITFIRFLLYILQKFLEGDSESEALSQQLPVTVTSNISNLYSHIHNEKNTTISHQQ